MILPLPGESSSCDTEGVVELRSDVDSTLLETIAAAGR